MQSSSEHTQHAQKTAVYALVETAELQSKLRLFSNKAFGWNKEYFVTNVVAVEHGRYSLPWYAETVSMQCWVCMVCWEFLSYVVNFTAAECGRIWYGSSFMWKAVERAVLSTVCI